MRLTNETIEYCFNIWKPHFSSTVIAFGERERGNGKNLL